jgi:hypothetical protein
MKTNKCIATAILSAALLGTAAFAQSSPSAAPAPNEVVYVPTLPSVADLTKAAAAQNVTVQQINQTSGQITVVYKYANGQVTTVAYQPLSAAENSALTAPAVAAADVPATAAPATVVYTTAPAYYYAPYPYYYGWGWYPPVSIGLGFGFRGGGFRGGFGGHFR